MRFFRRRNRQLGTPGGNPSAVDEVEANGPPPGPSGSDRGVYNAQREAAVRADLGADLGDDFDALGESEDALFGQLGKPAPPADD